MSRNSITQTPNLGGINQQTLTDLVTAEDSKSFRRNLNTVMEESKPRVDDGPNEIA